MDIITKYYNNTEIKFVVYDEFFISLNELDNYDGTREKYFNNNNVIINFIS